MGIKVGSGGKHKIIVLPGISLQLAMHMSLHPDGEAAPNPAALPDGKVDASERRAKPPQALAGATVEIKGTTIAATTDAAGKCKLPVATLPDGKHVIIITPAAQENAAPLVAGGSPQLRAQPSPAHLVAPPAVKLAYRGTSISIQVVAQKLVTQPFIVNAADKHARVLQGATPTSMEVDIKPDWVRDKDASARTVPIDLIVVHHTGGNFMPGDLATFTTTNKSIHYLLDVDGHVIKMVNDGEIAVHAGRSRWHGQLGVSPQSIGIEIVNGGASTPYSAEQQDAIVTLVDQILTKQSLPRHHVVGHEDIGTGDDNKPTSTVPLTKVGRKGGDPGKMFPWQLLEAKLIGLQLTNPPPNDATMYNGVFAKGAKTMPNTARPHVVELRQDLDAIGYSLNSTTVSAFDDHLAAAVFAFQRHFTTLGRLTRAPGEPKLSFGNVDIRTAREIKRCTRW